MVQRELVEYCENVKKETLFENIIFHLQSSNTRNYMDMIRDTCLMFWSFAAVYFFCHFGENVTTNFETLEDTFFECNWYLFPIKLQKSYLITAIAVQQPISIRGIGNVLCTRQSFKEVSKILS